MPTSTEIVNAALRKAGGAKRITDLSESIGSAGIASDVMSSELNDLLRSGVWNFCITRVQLAQLSVPPAFGWTFAYALPSDCDRVVSVHDNVDAGGSVPYKIESVKQADDSYVNVIATDANTVYLRYCRNVTDPNLMTPSFIQVLILRIAKIFALSIAKSASIYQVLDAEEKSAFRQARSIDGIEDYPEALPEGSWTTSRRGYGWRNTTSWQPR